MRIGSLRHLVTIQKSVETQDTFGGNVVTWAEYSKAYANIVPLSGSEKYVSAEKHATATHQITIRHLNGVYPKMRIMYLSRIFDIISVINTGERNKMIQIIAEEPINSTVNEFNCDAVIACDEIFECGA